MSVLSKEWDRYVVWWQGVAETYFDMIKRNPFFLQGMGILLQHHLEARKMIDLVMRETWRQVRLPSLDEITRLHERLTLLESKLIALQEEDHPRAMQPLPEGLDKEPVRRYG